MTRDDIITEARQRYEYALGVWGPIYDKVQDDLRFSDPTDPHQWTDEARRQRVRDGRPCLTFDQTGQFTRQVINQAIRNKPAMRFLPVGNGADMQAAGVFNGLARQTEYESRAQTAYVQSLNHSVRGGLGYFRAYTEPVPDAPVRGQLCIKIRRVTDIRCILPDPDFQEVDGSDMQWGFVEEQVPRDRFAVKYPHAKTIDNDGTWFSKDHVKVCEYFRVAGGKCEWFKITGEEVLERSVFPAPFVPIFPVIGNEEWRDGKRYLSGAVRLARDAQITYNFERNAEYEAAALAPKAPWLAPSEAINGHEDKWSQANRANLAYLPWNSVDERGNPIQKPDRVAPAPVATAWAQLTAQSRADVQAALGMFNASVGDNPNQQSGRAVIALQEKADAGSSHYIENLAGAIAHLGRVLVHAWPVIYDQAQIVRIIGDDDEPEFVQFDPSAPAAYQAMPMPDGADQIVINPQMGRYDVRATVGPNYTTRQTEAAAEIGEIVNGNPQLFAILGDVWVKMRNFPDADKVARRLRAMLPPQIQALEGEGQQQQIPPQVQQAMQAAAQEIQTLRQQLAEAQQGMQAEMLKAQTQLEVARENNDAKRDVEELKGMIQIILAKLQPPPMLAAEVAGDLGQNLPQ